MRQHARGRTFPHFVDDYLELSLRSAPDQRDVGRRPRPRRPRSRTSAARAIDTHLSALAGFARRLDAIPSTPLPARRAGRAPDRLGQHRARQFELEGVRSWERNPHVYADTLASSLAAQAIFAYAPETERARRVLSKLRQVPRLVQAARDNVKDPPAIFVKVGIDTLRGAMTFIDADLPRAFSGVDDMHLLGRSRRRVAPKPCRPSARTSSTRDRGAAQGQGVVPSRAREVRAEAAARRRHLAARSIACCAIAERELAATQEEFRTLAGRLNGGDPVEAWRKAKQQITPEPGTLIADRARADRRAADVSVAQPVVVDARRRRRRRWRRRPDFFRWSSASMWTPGPFETASRRAPCTTSPTSIRRGPTTRKLEHLRDFNIPTLWTISIHEVFPGHFLHYQHLRKVESKVRRSTLFAPASYIEGLGALLRADDARGRLRPPRPRAASSASSPKRWCASPASSSASGCTPTTGRSSRACASSATRRFSRKRTRAAKPSAARSIPTYLVYAAGQADAAEAAPRLAGAAGRQAVAARVPRCAAGAGRRRRSGRCAA